MGHPSATIPQYDYSITLTKTGVPNVYCEELNHQTGIEDFDFTPATISGTATRTFICDWNDRYNLMLILENAQHPNINFVYAQNFHIEPSGKPLGFGQWQQAIVYVTYKSLPYDPVTMKEVSGDVLSQSVAVPGEAFTYDSGTEPISQSVQFDPQVYSATEQINITFHLQPQLNEALWGQFVNCVNSQPIRFVTPGGITWPAGHVVYLGWSYSVKYTSAGKQFDITHKLEGGAYDLRQDFNPNTGSFDTIRTKAGGNTKYIAADFTPLGLSE